LEDICSVFLANAGADEVGVAGTAVVATCWEFVEAGAAGTESFELGGAGGTTLGLRTAGGITLKLGAKAGTQDVGICGCICGCICASKGGALISGGEGGVLCYG